MRPDTRVANEPTLAVPSLGTETTVQRLYYLLMGLGVGAIMPVTFLASSLLTSSAGREQ